MIAGDVERSQHKMKARLDNLGLRGGARVRWQRHVAGTSGECPDLARVGPKPRGRCDPLFSLRENAIAKEPGLSYLERWRCVS